MAAVTAPGRMPPLGRRAGRPRLVAPRRPARCGADADPAKFTGSSHSVGLLCCSCTSSPVVHCARGAANALMCACER